MCQTSVGLSNWSFTEKDFSGIVNTGRTSTTLTPVGLSSSIGMREEREFVSVFDSVVAGFQRASPEHFTLELPPGEGFADETVMNADDEATKMRPRTETVGKALGALQASGRYTASTPFVSVEHSPTLDVLVRKLELMSHRLGVKIGVIFVREGCEDQNQILATTWEETSVLFREFMTGIGWPVKLESHYGYNGGLDTKNSQNGVTSVYYADFMNEIMFHIAPLIPTDPSDHQQIYKKRHIGNDHIHIVWSEANQEYDPSTITSQFNQAHIIVYPLETGLFRVDVRWRQELLWFGPLRWNVIVNKKALPSLVRATAVAAMDAFYRSQSPFLYPQNEMVEGRKTVLAQHLAAEEKYASLQNLMQLSE
jgi:hypothetical protein